MKKSSRVFCLGNVVVRQCTCEPALSNFFTNGFMQHILIFLWFQDEGDYPRRKRPSAMTLPHLIRPVKEITQEELDNICETVRDKVYNRVTVRIIHIVQAAILKMAY